MAWFRRGRGAQPIAPEPSPENGSATLRLTLRELNGYINQNAGRLPVESVVTAFRVVDTLREVIDSSADGELDIYAVVAVEGILTDYLPTTLKSFLALDPSQLDLPWTGGRTPTEALQEQLDSLWDAASDVLVAARTADVNGLMTQGNFLRTKFSRSDLDL